MGEVLKFPGPDRRLCEALSSVREDLERIGEELRLCAINLAAEGVWREWNDSMPDGTVFCFDADMLMGSGDDVVRRLVELDMAVDALGDELDTRLGRRASD